MTSESLKAQVDEIARAPISPEMKIVNMLALVCHLLNERSSQNVPVAIRGEETASRSSVKDKPAKHDRV